MFNKFLIVFLLQLILFLSGCSSTQVLEESANKVMIDEVTVETVNHLSQDRKHYSLVDYNVSLIHPSADCIKNLNIESNNNWILLSGTGSKTPSFAVQVYNLVESMDLEASEFYLYNQAYYKESIASRKKQASNDIWMLVDRQMAVNLHPAYQVAIAENQRSVITETAVLQNGLLFTVTGMYPWSYMVNFKSFADLPSCYSDFVRSVFVQALSNTKLVEENEDESE